MYLDLQYFHRRSSKFPAEHLSFCTVFWVSSFYLSVNIVVLYQFTATCIENFASKVEARGLSNGKKVQDGDYVFGSSATFQRRKEWICESRFRQGRQCSFTCICGIFLPLNPSTITVYARSAF